MMPPAHILVVDDDAETASLLVNYLARFNMEASTACDGPSTHAQLRQQPIDLVVLDRVLHGTDGLVLCREIRAQSAVPIIMLTARDHPMERVMGLESGADDYMGKPFVPRELVARIQTVLRRSARATALADTAYSDVVCFDGWELHREERHLVAPDGSVVPLSNAEFRLLSTFLQTPRHLLSGDQLMTHARGRAMDAFERSIDLLVSRLRQKLADDTSEPSMIKTVRGAGYLFDVQAVRGRQAMRA